MRGILNDLVTAQYTARRPDVASAAGSVTHRTRDEASP
jgi:hypothetical protein